MNRWRSRGAVAAVALLAASLGGCRSDGGLGRKDSLRSLGWAAGRVAQHTRDDAATCVERIVAAPGAALDGAAESLSRMEDSYRLYFEGTEKRR